MIFDIAYPQHDEDDLALDSETLWRLGAR